jgi:hypothetical protein
MKVGKTLMAQGESLLIADWCGCDFGVDHWLQRMNSITHAVDELARASVSNPFGFTVGQT